MGPDGERFVLTATRAPHVAHRGAWGDRDRRHPDEPRLTTPGRGRRAAIVAAVLAALGLLAWSPVPLCWTALLFHVPCPGCGMTRAAMSLIRGEVGQAFALQPLSPLVVPLGAIFGASRAAAYVRKGQALDKGDVPRTIERFAAALVVALVIVWLARFAGFFGGPVFVGHA